MVSSFQYLSMNFTLNGRFEIRSISLSLSAAMDEVSGAFQGTRLKGLTCNHR
jgi:predicted membrane-bound dolichyl-phosphate-mannose-protein mannosyltransferase